MNFFTEDDLLEVRKWDNIEYDADNVEHQQVRQFLIDSPETKTRYWARQTAEKLGMDQKTIRNPRKRGHNASIFKGYTWGRIFQKDQITEEVFFTVGINGSKEKKKSPFLHLKIDRQFQRSSELTDEQQSKLKQLLVKDNGEYRYEKKIYLNEITKLNWKDLVNTTISFIEKHELVFNNVLTAITAEQKKFFTRICWNTNGWRNPSGREGKSDSNESFEGITGFGMEEWLFAEDSQVDGFQYGFLQGVNQNQPQQENFNVDLYTVENTKQDKIVYWVCSIKDVQILSKEEAYRIQKRTGFEKIVKKHLNKIPELKHVNESISSFVGDQFLNVRYRLSDVIFPETKDIPIIDFDLSNFPRYLLFKGSLFDKVSDLKKETSTGYDELGDRSGSRSRNRISTGTRSPGSYEITHIHDEISRSVETSLKANMKSGEKVNYEVPLGSYKAVDLVYEKENSINYYEIKTHPKLILCIREGIGQLLEYGYYNRREHEKKLNLILVSTHKATEELKLYMEKLRKMSEFNIYYERYNRTTEKLELPI
ncbi:MAG: hypothetical protein JXR20_04655 [Balneola sp.]